jgi:hypothetical protein
MTRFIRITVLFLLLLVLGIGDSTAQSVWQPITVTGQVVDAADGQPLVGVNICYRRDDALAGYVHKDITDYDGHFKLSYPRKYVMTAARIGYIPQQLHFSSDTTILIRLEKDPAVVKCPEIYLASGVVLDEENDEPLIGASVLIKDTDIGVATDINGEFKIALQKGTVLEISYVGCSKKTVKISKKEPMIIKLKPIPHECVP